MSVILARFLQIAKIWLHFASLFAIQERFVAEPVIG